MTYKKEKKMCLDSRSSLYFAISAGFSSTSSSLHKNVSSFDFTAFFCTTYFKLICHLAFWQLLYCCIAHHLPCSICMSHLFQACYKFCLMKLFQSIWTTADSHHFNSLSLNSVTEYLPNCFYSFFFYSFSFSFFYLWLFFFIPLPTP